MCALLIRGKQIYPVSGKEDTLVEGNRVIGVEDFTTSKNQHNRLEIQVKFNQNCTSIITTRPFL